MKIGPYTRKKTAQQWRLKQRIVLPNAVGEECYVSRDKSKTDVFYSLAETREAETSEKTAEQNQVRTAEYWESLDRKVLPDAVGIYCYVDDSFTEKAKFYSYDETRKFTTEELKAKNIRRSYYGSWPLKADETTNPLYTERCWAQKGRLVLDDEKENFKLLYTNGYCQHKAMYFAKSQTYEATEEELREFFRPEREHRNQLAKERKIFKKKQIVAKQLVDMLTNRLVSIAVPWKMARIALPCFRESGYCIYDYICEIEGLNKGDEVAVTGVAAGQKAVFVEYYESYPWELKLPLSRYEKVVCKYE